MLSLILATLLAFPHPKSPAPPASSAAPAPLSDDELRQRIEGFLDNIDTRIPAEHWKALGARGADLLLPIAQDASGLPSRRARALGGAVLAAPERAAPVAAALAQDDAQPAVVRIAALRGVGRTATAAAATQSVAKVLRTARDAGVRGVAAEVMAASGGCAEVKAQVAREEADQRPAYRRALARCGE